ncbi:SGNH/GDSL hydrolase family protein [Pseudonocardia sp. GCM10023141]|uniref:SGNH/GDSL hydrolase family protein n=1 Tax=Pseudonocardia sp. GCM10023141 TaxID=3252653 RepID=UPI00361FFFE5
MRRRAVLPLFAAVLTALITVAPSAAAAPASPYREYVALGDSWSADVVLLGPPTAKYAPLDCFQATYNYPKQVAAALGVPKFADATCGSATTDDFAAPQGGLPLGGTNPPQFARLTRTTDLVTVGIGGNDTGFTGYILGCLNLLPSISLLPGLGLPAPLGGSCKQALTAGGVDKISAGIAAAEPKVLAAMRTLHTLVAPDARVLMVNYLDAVPEQGCWPYVPVLNEDMPYLHEKFGELNAMVARVAAASGSELVDVFTPSAGHDVCQSPFTRYVEAVVPVSLNGPALAVPLHPNSAGAASQTRTVLDAIRSGTAAGSPAA